MVLLACSLTPTLAHAAQSNSSPAFLIETDTGPVHFPSCASPITWSLDPRGIPSAGSTVARETVLWTTIFDELDIATDYDFTAVPFTDDTPGATAILIEYATADHPRAPGASGALAHGGITGIESRGGRWVATASIVTIDASAWRTWRHDPGMGKWLARHELGHALGLGHSTDRTQVMTPRYQPRRSPTAYQAEDLAGLHHLASIGCRSD